ncbi:HEAT repeat domain-containing protein [Treponema sp. OMZ 840]|uniref:HEAT repeat domain-containing protein n=1 Tax=Treponema sp. OMZ 840 TaxID=244313 RepID=UPI003D8F0032
MKSKYKIGRAALWCVCLVLCTFVFSAEKGAAAGSGGAGGAENVQAEEKSQTEKRKETLLYGLEGEVVNLIDTLIKEGEAEFLPELHNVFASAKSTALKDKIITYYTEFKYEGLKDYTLGILEDPYDEKKSTVILLIRYAEKLAIAEAAPFLKAIIESENEAFFESAVSALGTIGTGEDAVFFTELFAGDLSIIQKQSIAKALGKLKADESWDMLVEAAENEDENTFVRMYAAEAIGNIRPEEAGAILLRLFDSTDPNLRQYVVKGFAKNTSDEARSVLSAALKDNHYKVRLEAVEAVKEQKLTDAAASLLYRAKNDTEAAVKYACFDALSSFHDADGVEYMISILKEEKRGDTLKAKIAASLLKYDVKAGVDAVTALALKTVGDDKKKNLRYALGKEFAKYENAAFESVCEAYMKSSDVATKGTGLDIYKKNPFASLEPLVRTIADEDKAAPMRAKAKALLDTE